MKCPPFSMNDLARHEAAGVAGRGADIAAAISSTCNKASQRELHASDLSPGWRGILRPVANGIDWPPGATRVGGDALRGSNSKRNRLWQVSCSSRLRGKVRRAV